LGPEISVSGQAGRAVTDDGPRPGEVALAADPGTSAPDAGLVFIGRAGTPWRSRADCPKNMREARERAAADGALAFRLALDAPFRPGLADLSAGAILHVFLWMHEARRDLIVQAPRHRDGSAGVFSLRSPVRPNPIGLSTVRVRDIDAGAGLLAVDALDCLDGTPILDLKPWIGTVDVPPDALAAWR
jgi:tRNA-Thr(GGU) m(6)t(6)A37 methyltransferase TsaA